MPAVISRTIAGTYVVVEIDTIVNEQHVMSNQVTDHPVEIGANVSDHSRPEPDMLQLECIITNHPFSPDQRERSIRQGSTTITSNQPDEVPDRAAVSYAQLKDLRDTGALLTVQTSLRQYDSMVLQSLTIPRDARTANAIRFTASFKTVRVVQNKFTQAPVMKKVAGGGKKQKIGNVTPFGPIDIEHSRLTRIVDSAKGKGFAGGAADGLKSAFDGLPR